MRTLKLFSLTAWLGAASLTAVPAWADRAITDMAGRNVTLPDEVKAVSCVHPIPCHMIWRLARTKMISASKQFKERLVFMSEARAREMADLPTTAEFHNAINREQMLSLRPDVIVSLNKDPRLDREQEEFAAPVVASSKNTLEDYETSWRFIGQIVGAPREGDNLADYWKATTAKVTEPVSEIPARDRARVYYAAVSVTTTPGAKTIMSSIIRAAGGVGFYDEHPNIPAQREDEAVPTSMEEIVMWNPDVIITGTAKGRTQILSDPHWESIKAVRNGRVYASLNWERLDGIQSLLGLVWTGIKLYPDKVKLDFEGETRRFYSKIYLNDDVTNDQIYQERN